MIKKLVRYGLKTIAWTLGTLVFLWIALWIYVELNEAKLIGKIASSISEKTHGEVKIGGASVSLIRTFPILSLQLSDVVLRDSLYYAHKKDFLSASDIYLRISLRDIIRGRSALGRITINNGSINILTDSTGRSNEYVLSQQKAPESQQRSSVPEIVLNNLDFHYANAKRNKLYEGVVRKMKCAITTNDHFVVVDMDINALTNGLAFNTRKGSYVKNTNIAGRFAVTYNKEDHDLVINHVRLRINDHPFVFDGYFRIDKVRSDFNLNISTENIEFNAATAMLSDALQERFEGYDFSKPVTVQVTVYGETVSRFGPDVRIKMPVDMSTVVRAAGITSLQYTGGTSDVDITIVSSSMAKDTMNGDLNGTIRLKDVGIRYLPRNFTLERCTGDVHFDSNDILIDSLSAVAGQTKMLLNGKTRNLITLGSKDPGKLAMHWSLSTPELHIKDFKSFLSKGNFGTKQSSLDKLFSSGDIYVALSAAKMDYNKFRASHVTGQLVMQQSGIKMQNIFFNHANGSMRIDGDLINGAATNPVSLKVKMKNMDVPLLFAAFDNFGQDAVTQNNLKGRLSANINFNTSVSNQGKVNGEDSRGTVDFLLENGELNNFEPLIEVSKKAFKKQNMANIKFANLKNRLDISGSTFIINPMEIRSSAFTLFVEGVYDIKKGTDMSIRFPLRNITKSQAGTDLGEGAKVRKGIGLLLRARTGEDGKLKVSWDPFRKSIKNRDQALDSLDAVKDKPTK